MGRPVSETLGQYLRRERESRSVSLEEVSRGTRISRPFLDALERDDFQFFSQQEYIGGFLRGYARYIGLDGQEVLKRYAIQSELTRRKEAFRQLPLFPSTPAHSDEASESRRMPPKVPFPTNPRPSRRGLIVQLLIILAAVSLSLYLHFIIKQPKEGEIPPATGSALQQGAGKKDSAKDGLFPMEKRGLPLNNPDDLRVKAKKN